MAIYIETKRQDSIINKIKELIDNGKRNNGKEKIATWDYSGNNFVHTTSSHQWKDEAYLKAFPNPENNPEYLVFGVKKKLKTLRRYVYGVYQGRFIEELISHLYPDFKWISVSANPNTNYDDEISE
jgi:hypothetical protein